MHLQVGQEHLARELGHAVIKTWRTLHAGHLTAEEVRQPPLLACKPHGLLEPFEVLILQSCEAPEELAVELEDQAASTARRERHGHKAAGREKAGAAYTGPSRMKLEPK